MTIASNTVTSTGMFAGRSGGDAMGFREQIMETGLHNGARCTMRIHLPFLAAAVSIMALLWTAVAPCPNEARSQIQAQGGHEQRIEIVIEDRTFFLAKGGPIQVGTPIEIVLENRDQVRHGFTSSMLIGLLVSGEDDQIATYGKGVEGFYVNPGKTLVIRFSTERPGSFPFHCDLHERMKGELYVLEIPTA
jgi:plastocyanin